MQSLANPEIGLAVKDEQEMTTLKKPLVLLSNANDLRNKATRKARKAHPRNLFVLINNEPKRAA